MNRRVVWVVMVAAAAAVLSAGLFWFQPWTALRDTTVNDALPAVALDQTPAANVTGPALTATTPHSATPSTTPHSATPATTTPEARGSSARPSAVLLARGRLITHEHDTSGRVSIVRQPDGSRVLAIVGLDTSDGPDVKIWLTDRPVRSGEKGWYVFDDGRYVDLGELKGNRGNQVYQIPRDVDLSRYRSVSLWCDRFNVSFGAATLTPA